MLAGLVVCMLVLISALAATLFPDMQLSRRAAQVADLAVYPLLLGAPPCSTHTCASAAAMRPNGWWPPAAFGTAQGTAYAALRVAMEPEASADNGWLAVAEVVVAALLAAMLAASDRVRLTVNPLLLGLSLASLVTTGRLLLLAWAGPWPAIPGCVWSCWRWCWCCTASAPGCCSGGSGCPSGLGSAWPWSWWSWAWPTC